MKTPCPFRFRSIAFTVTAALVFLQAAHAWRSVLYPADWSPPQPVAFNTDLFLQDFSHAGYGHGEVPLPWVEGPVFNVLDYGADSDGLADSTLAIQTAINAAAAAGGGVVYLPEGLYIVAPAMGSGEALLISDSHVILRGDGVGRTRLLNTDTFMRSKALLRIANGAGSWLKNITGKIAVTQDLPGPTVQIPVADLSGFAVGDSIVIHAEASPAWISEHGMDTAEYWLGQGSVLGGVAFKREIVAIDTGSSTLIVDTPTRYFLKTRDNASVYKTHPQLTGVGVEHLSMGNVEHPGTSGWSEEDYNNPANSSYDVHDSWLIRMQNVRDGWIRGVTSFQADGNSLGTHMLSNGILILDSRNVTVRDCDMQKVQYGGGGGNGYTYRFQNSQEILLVNCAARYQRHGYVQSHMRNSGNVFHRVLTQDTKKQTAGSGTTNGSGSDHHMHLSQSMLFDQASADRDYYDARFRFAWGTVAHGLSAVGSVYWNTRGNQPAPSRSHLIRSDQFGYGYVIGTSGSTDSVDLSLNSSSTSPADFLEGEGAGGTLEPQSLYLDQLLKRTGLTYADPEIAWSPGMATLYAGEAAYALLSVDPLWQAANPDGRVVRWNQANGPASATILHPDDAQTLVHLPVPGIYSFDCMIDNGWLSTNGSIVLELRPEAPTQVTIYPEADGYVRGGTYAGTNFGQESELWVKYSTNSDFERKSFIRFPIANDPSQATAAYVELTVTDPAESPDLDVFLTGGSFTDGTLTWNTRPTASTSLGQFVIETTISIPIPITELINQYAADGTLGIGLSTTIPTTGITRFGSREAADETIRPRLLIDLPGAPGYPTWAEAEFGPATVANPALEADTWGPDADPDKDRLTNILERSLGGNPNSFTPQPLSFNDEASAIRFAAATGTPLPDIEFSTNLSGWGVVDKADYRILSVGTDWVDFEVPAPADWTSFFARMKMTNGEN